jgi:predicted kinase
MSPDAVRGVLFTGTIGAGKTVLAEAASQQLHEAGIRHALLDVDWLGQVYPPLDESDPHTRALAYRNLAAIWPNFVEAGIVHAVLADTVTGRGQLDLLKAAVPGCELTVVRVVAPPEMVAARIRSREVGGLLEDFLRRTEAVAELVERAHMEDVTVTNDDRPPQEIGAELLQELGWIRPSPEG